MNAQLAAREDAPVSLGDWVITLIVLAIPVVGFIMLFVWGFTGGTHPSKQNFCRASLILYLIAIVVFVFFMMAGGFAAMEAARSMGGAQI